MAEINDYAKITLQQLILTAVSRRASAEGRMALRLLKLDEESLSMLEDVTSEQLDEITEDYLSSEAATFLKLNQRKLKRLVIEKTGACEVQQLADQFLSAGATKEMMYLYFGIRSTELKSMRERLNLKSVRGRKSRITSSMQKRIFDCWMSQRIHCERKRLLEVARLTSEPLWAVFHVAEVANPAGTYYRTPSESASS